MKNYSIFKKSVSIIIVLALLLGLGIESISAYGDGAFDAYGVTLDHRSISFSIMGAESAQPASVTIDLATNNEFNDNNQKDSSSATHIEMSFEITSPNQEINLTFPEGQYLESKLYYTVKITDSNSKIIYEEDESFYSHSLFCSDTIFQSTGGVVTSVDENVSAASVFIGFTEYKGTKSGDNFYFSYPEQAAGNEILIALYDEYGCKEEYRKEIEDKIDTINADIDISASYVCADNAYAYLTADKDLKYRLCATISDNVYYGDYVQGKGSSGSVKLKVSYPAQKPSIEVTLVIESEYGAKSSEFKRKVYNRPYKIKVQNTRTTGLTAYLYDSKKETVYKKISKATLTFKNKEYNGKLNSSKYKFTYSANVGDSVKLKFVDTDGYTYTKSLKIPQGDGKLELLKCNADGAVFRFRSNYSKIKSITFLANNKKCKVKNYTKSDYNDDKYSDFCEYNKSFKYDTDWIYKKADYTVKYNKKIKLTLKTKDRYVYTKNAKAEYIKPYLNVDNIYSDDNSVFGATDNKLKVTIKVGKKNYTAKSNKYGYFNKKIKPAKSGTKVKITAFNKLTGCKATVNKKIKIRKGSIKFNSTIYKTNSSVKVTYTNARKGDKIKLIANGESYYVPIIKNKKKTVFTFPTGQMPAGAKLKLYYTDKFGTKKASVKTTTVLFSKNIYKGMPARYCELTTWGRATNKVSYDDYHAWMFERGGAFLCAYIHNGVVTNIGKDY